MASYPQRRGCPRCEEERLIKQSRGPTFALFGMVLRTWNAAQQAIVSISFFVQLFYRAPARSFLSHGHFLWQSDDCACWLRTADSGDNPYIAEDISAAINSATRGSKTLGQADTLQLMVLRGISSLLNAAPFPKYDVGAIPEM